MALLVAMRDETTGADGSWGFGVTAGEARRCTHAAVEHRGRLLLRLAALPLSHLPHLGNRSGSAHC